jgi:hypothetical protein
MTQRPVSRIFLIGFNRCGGAWFRDVFQAAGLRWRHDRTGDLAADIAWHRAAGTRPMERWPRLVGLSGLQRWNRPHLPRIEAFRDFAFLEAQFPDALFIFNDRDPEAWVASRYFHRDGRFVECEARHRDCHRRDLPQLWCSERAAHRRQVLHHFAGKPRFLHFDLSRDADAKLVDWVAPWVTLGDLPPGRGIESAAESSAEIDALAEDLRARARRPRRRPGRPTRPLLTRWSPIASGRWPGAATTPRSALLRPSGAPTGALPARTAALCPCAGWATALT